MVAQEEPDFLSRLLCLQRYSFSSCFSRRDLSFCNFANVVPEQSPI